MKRDGDRLGFWLGWPDVLLWLVVVGVLVVCFALAGCGSVTTAAVEGNDASQDGRELAPEMGSMVPESPRDAGPVSTPGEGGTAGPACAPWTSPPYCSSCRDARGVCLCGALPCCDQHCQS